MSEVFDDLKKLSETLEKGDITPYEYDKLKADLLGDLDTSPSSLVSLPNAGQFGRKWPSSPLAGSMVIRQMFLPVPGSWPSGWLAHHHHQTTA